MFTASPVQPMNSTKETTGTSVTLKEKLSKDARYTIKVRAGKDIYGWHGEEHGQLSYQIRCSGKIHKSGRHQSKRILSESVKDQYYKQSKKACADGYQYQLYTAYKGQDKETKVKSITVNQNNPGSSNRVSASMKISALKNHNFYKVRVRAYSLNSKNEKIYGVWSSWKYVSPQPDVTKET